MTSLPNPFDARAVFFDGPLALYVHKATREELERAYNRLGDYLSVAADGFALEDSIQAIGAVPRPSDDCGGSAGGEGG